MSDAFVIIKMSYVHNQWYGISCATLYAAASTELCEDHDEGWNCAGDMLVT